MIAPITYTYRTAAYGRLREVTVTRSRPAWWADVLSLHADRLNDCEIGRRLSRNRYAVNRARRALGLPANASRGRPRKVAP